jgi:two-component system, NtrC family, nitrogen regulation response regulator NtrX
MILICDDEKNIRRTLAMVLESEGYVVRVATTASEALVLLTEGTFEVVVLDVLLPDQNGLETLRQIKEGDSGIEVIMISGHASLQDAVEATRLGAFDFLEKPIDRDRLLITLRNALERNELKGRVKVLTQRDDPVGILGDSPPMRHLLAEIEKVAATKARILITGESGTGKELVARAVHRLSPRATRPFVKVNCAAIPHDLIESELFGHQKGAFTGALRARKGQFEIAHTGTLLLDEVGDMSLRAQAKVLRVIQTGELTRVGGEVPSLVDVRVIAATNKDLRAEIDRGRFREDLFFRLNVVPLETPPLREHAEDVAIMVEAFLDYFAKEHNLPRKQVTPEVLARLQAYRWPGNVRELKNLVERLLIMGHDPIELSDLPDYVHPVRPTLSVPLGVTPGSTSLKDFRELAERAYIEASLKSNDWNVSRTAEHLGVERTNLHKKIKQYGLEREL